mmetsp:Transcript_6163/g.24528  ORF Transcript_6163/g.24528 Transcript_6163/m.24528 type:complete len:239 (-) Transcript_6163:1994-2710(-)
MGYSRARGASTSTSIDASSRSWWTYAATGSTTSGGKRRRARSTTPAASASISGEGLHVIAITSASSRLTRANSRARDLCVVSAWSSSPSSSASDDSLPAKSVARWMSSCASSVASSTYASSPANSTSLDCKPSILKGIVSCAMAVIMGINETYARTSSALDGSQSKSSTTFINPRKTKNAPFSKFPGCTTRRALHRRTKSSISAPARSVGRSIHPPTAVSPPLSCASVTALRIRPSTC